MAGIGRDKYLVNLIKTFPELFEEYKHVGQGFFVLETKNLLVHICQPKKLLGELKRLAPLAGAQWPSNWEEEDYRSHVCNSITVGQFVEHTSRAEWDKVLDRYYCTRCGTESNKKVTMILMIKDRIKV